MGLVGRETELAVLADALAHVRSGGRRVVVLIGEAGIGKSALLGVATERAAAAKMLALTGRGAEHERAVPYALVVDALDDHVGDLGVARVRAAGPEVAAVLPAAARLTDGAPRAAPMTSPADRFALHRALRNLVELLGRERPLVLLLDDLHWADEASIEWLLHLLRHPPRVAHALVLAMRRSGVTERVLDAARQAGELEELRVAPLPERAARALLPESVPSGVRGKLLAEAHGNPLFLRELARAALAGEELTETLVGAVGREVAAIPPASRALLEGAAVVGDPFDPDLAATAAGIARTDALDLFDRLAAADLVRPASSPRSFAFRHPLVRRVIYEAAPPGARLKAHERVADALSRMGADPSEFAYHVERYAAIGDESAIAILLRAAEAARGSAPATSAHWYGVALRLLPHGDLDRRARLLAPLATGLASGGRLEEARDAVLEALAVAPSLTEDGRAQLIDVAASIENLLGRHADARRRLEQAVREAPSGARERLAWNLAGTYWHLGDASSLAVTAQALLAAEPPVLRAGARALAAQARLLAGEPAGDGLDAALRELAAAPDEDVLASLGPAVGVAIAGRVAERTDGEWGSLHTRLAELARGAGLGQLASIAATTLGWHLLDAFAPREALEQLELAEELGDLSGGSPVLVTNLRLQALVREILGDFGGARRAAMRAVDAGERRGASVLARASRLGAELALHRGDAERIASLTGGIAGRTLDGLEPSVAVWLALELTRSAVAAGRREDAAGWVAWAADRSCGSGLPLAAARAFRAEAELALAGEDAGAAARLAGDARALADAAGGRWDALEAELLRGRALIASGAVAEGSAAIQGVASEATRAGAAGMVDAAARELRRAGTRVSRRAAHAQAAGTGPAGLSGREREIAELVAVGRTNKEVATTLFLSEKTVENHLSRVFAKLGVRRRTELSAVLTAAGGESRPS